MLVFVRMRVFVRVRMTVGMGIVMRMGMVVRMRMHLAHATSRARSPAAAALDALPLPRARGTWSPTRRP